MVKKLKCKKIKKHYVIPTKDWLVPLEKLIIKDVSTKGR
jgi:hypothetical protein